MKASDTIELKIDQEFNSRLPKLNPDEYQRLEKSIITEGCRDALVVWDGIILDGHNRYEICQRHDISFSVMELQFDSRKDARLWIIDYQLAKRNLTTQQKRELIAQRLRLAPEQSDRRIAERSGVGHKTVGAERRRLESTGEIPQLDKSVGMDGKERPRKTKGGSTLHKFNETNEKIEWAKWTWNPYTGCLGPDGKGCCEYCYARDIANRFYPEKFEPTFRPERLDAPFNTKIPEKRKDEPGIHNVFCVSMGDLFGDWVESNWIEQILEVVRRSPQWNYIFLTKNPKRMIDIHWPDNAWAGTTVDIQARVRPAEEAFKSVRAPVKFVSCEPFLEELRFDNIDLFDWVIIGGQTMPGKRPAKQPEWEWVMSLLRQAHDAGCSIYIKPNLTLLRGYPSMNPG
jgi:protein gp37